MHFQDIPKSECSDASPSMLPQVVLGRAETISPQKEGGKEGELEEKRTGAVTNGHHGCGGSGLIPFRLVKWRRRWLIRERGKGHTVARQSFLLVKAQRPAHYTSNCLSICWTLHPAVACLICCSRSEPTD